MAWTFWRVVECSTFPNQTPAPPPHPTHRSVGLGRRLASERDRKPVSQRKLSFWGCLVSTERGGVKRLVVSAASAMSFAWVSVSYYTNAKLVKKDLCILSNYFCFFPLSLSLSPYFHIWLTQRPSARSLKNPPLLILHFVVKWLQFW